MQRFTPKQLQEYLAQNSNEPLLLDVREPWEFEICHIDGSVNLPMGQIPTAANDLDQDKDTVVICHHGMRSMQVCVYLNRMGFTQLINLDGGVDAWAKEVDPTMASY